jgi:uncharacterized protein with HEPN domain
MPRIDDYLHIDLDVVWDTVQNSIPELILLLEPLAPADDE